MIIPIVLQLLIILGNGMAMAPMVMVAAQPWHTCGASNYTADSMYQLNLDGMSASLFPEGAGGSGGGIFVRGSSVADPDKVYAVALCRGDVDDAPACSSCFNAAFRRAMQLCPRSKDAAIYYDECLLRFSDTDILNMDSVVRRLNTSEIVDGALVLMNLTSEPMLPGWDDDSRPTATTNFTGFLKTMLTDVVGQVLSTRRHYAAIRMEMDDGSSSSTTAVPREFYCLAQCAPDLIEDICYSCLTNFSDRARELGIRADGRGLSRRSGMELSPEWINPPPTSSDLAWTEEDAAVCDELRRGAWMMEDATTATSFGVGWRMLPLMTEDAGHATAGDELRRDVDGGGCGALATSSSVRSG
uniref:Gnk2-homologous domain-containing protein n=1 Tax=Oryza glumipatula TaxID=40148 RepID=A0A0D9YA85_9ORYZ